MTPSWRKTTVGPPAIALFFLWARLYLCVSGESIITAYSDSSWAPVQAALVISAARMKSTLFAVVITTNKSWLTEKPTLRPDFRA